MRATTAYDVLILGGGTAGCVLAARLSENPDRSVCLVEAGPDYGPHGSGRWPDELLDARAIPDSHDWSDDDHTLAVARVIAGCSAHNLCFWVHPAPEDWDDWAAATGEDGWSARGIRPAIERVEERIPLQLAAGERINPWLETMIEAAEELGLGTGADINRLGEGLAPMPLNADGSTRVNAAFAYLDQARGRANLTIRDRCLIDRVELAGDRAVGAVVRGPEGETVLAAKRVVVSAGAYGSPAVLLRSGIGPGEELRRHLIELRAELPVGTRLEDHFATRFRLAPSEAMQRRLDQYATTGPTFVCQGLLKGRSSRCPQGLWDLHGVIVAIPAADAGFPERTGHVLGLSSSLLKPAWTGTVTLRSADPETLPEVSPYRLDDAGDAATMLEGLELCGRLVETRAAREAWTEQLLPDPGLDGEALRRWCERSLSSYFHPVGTCAMGREGDGISTVSADGRVHGLEGLHVADASIIPTVPRANTNLAVLAVAERIAERIAVA